MATPRTRIWQTDLVTGSTVNYSPPSTVDHSYYQGISVVDDVVGNRNGDNPFSSEKVWRYAGAVNGEIRDPYGNLMSQHINVPHGSMDAPSHLSFTSTPPSVSEAATRGIARTGPGRPVVSLPVFIGELKDSFLGLFEEGNKKVAKARHKKRVPRTSNSVAEYNFGWAPLFGDLQKMLNFSEHLDDRVRELNALHSSDGLKRKWTTWSDVTTSRYNNVVIWSTRGVYNADIVQTTYGRQWVSTRWRPKGLNHKPTPQEIRQQAAYAVHGWRISPADAWELMPWSWFIDYFSNVGEFLEAATNMAQFDLESCCVMKSVRSVRTIAKGKWSLYYPGYTLRHGSSWRLSKTRALGTAGITVTQPILSAKQLATVSGIFANR